MFVLYVGSANVIQHESPHVLVRGAGWLYRQETAGAAKLWRMYFGLVESHVGGAVIRLFTSPVTKLHHTKAALEAAVSPRSCPMALIAYNSHSLSVAHLH